jgi:hypothetical protein
MKATHRISASYCPKTEEIELIWEDIDAGKEVKLFKKVTEEEGIEISNVVPPCTYHPAINGHANLLAKLDAARDELSGLVFDLSHRKVKAVDRDWMDSLVHRAEQVLRDTEPQNER